MGTKKLRKPRIWFSLSKLTPTQVVATVLLLFWALCPMAFALERGRQEGKRVARQVISRLVGAERVDSLMDQIRTMDVGGDFITNGGVTSLTRPEATYVFNHVARQTNGSVDGLITVYDPVAKKVGDVDLTVALLSNNEIGFNASVVMPGDQGWTEWQSWTEEVTLLGVRGGAEATVSVDGGVARTAFVDFGESTARGDPSSSTTFASSPTITPLGAPLSPDEGSVAARATCPSSVYGGGDGTGCVASATVCVVVIIVAVVFILFLCAIGWWWGC